MKQISYNREASHNYFIDEELVCGVILIGNEVKSLRENGTSLKECWCTVQNNRLVLRGMHIKKWKTSNVYDLKEEDRERELLVKKKELVKLQEKVKEKGCSLIPVSIYFDDNNRVKVLLGVCRGKHTYDKRQDLKEKQVKRDIAKEFKNSNRG